MRQLTDRPIAARHGVKLHNPGRKPEVVIQRVIELGVAVRPAQSFDAREEFPVVTTQEE